MRKCRIQRYCRTFNEEWNRAQNTISTGFSINEKAAVFDIGTVGDDFFQNISFLIVNHCTPDKIPLIQRLLDHNPDIVVVGTTTVLNFIGELSGREFKRKSVKSGMVIDLGDITLKLLFVPNVNRNKCQNRGAFAVSRGRFNVQEMAGKGGNETEYSNSLYFLVRIYEADG